jgi:DNA phosphorothioation-dependent restriction protein DptG
MTYEKIIEEVQNLQQDEMWQLRSYLNSLVLDADVIEPETGLSQQMRDDIVRSWNEGIHPWKESNDPERPYDVIVEGLRQFDIFRKHHPNVDREALAKEIATHVQRAILSSRSPKN